MSYTNKEIKARAVLLFGGELSPKSERVLETFCVAAAEEIKAKLRKDLSPDDLGEIFVTAAGMLALALCMELENADTGDVEAFRAGNLSVNLRGNTGSASAAGYRRAAESLLEAYLDREGFSFMGVMG